MKNLSALILGLSSMYAVAQEQPPMKQLYPYSTELQVQVPLQQRMISNTDSVTIAAVIKQFIPQQRIKPQVFYQDILDVYTQLYPIYEFVKHPIRFNDPALQFEMHDLTRAGIRFQIDHPQRRNKFDEMKSLYDELDARVMDSL